MSRFARVRVPAVLCAALCSLMIPIGADAAPQQADSAKWLWASPKIQEGAIVYFRRPFEVSDGEKCLIDIVADNEFWLYVNDRFVGSREGTSFENAWVRFDISDAVTSGANIVGVRVRNLDGAAGFAAKLSIVGADGKVREQIPTDPTWKAQQQVIPGWNAVRSPIQGWKPSHVIGDVGKTQPWGAVSAAAETYKYEQPTGERRKDLRLKDSDRVAWVGATFIERAQRYGYLEASLRKQFPGRRFEMRNLGWSGDTVWADSRGIFDQPAIGYQRMIDQVREIRPTLTVLSYGANESFSGPEKLDEFLAQYSRLIDTVEQNGAQVVLATPIRQIHLTPFIASFASPAALQPQTDAINAGIEAYADAIRELARSRDLPVLEISDLYEQTKKTAAALGKGVRISEDGVHLNQTGYAIAAPMVAARWAAMNRMLRADSSVIRIDTKTGRGKSGIGKVAVKPIGDGLDIAVTGGMLGAFKAGELQLAPVRLKVSGLKGGRYELKCGNAGLGVYTEAELAAGVPVTAGLPVEQADKLLQAVVDKNELYFHHWRPQNITYLTGFRRHEQGGNAKEIAEFRELVSGAEKRVFELARPVDYKLTVRPAAK